MKIVVLNGSPRKGGNTEIMAEAFSEGASKNNHNCQDFKCSRYEYPWMSGVQILLFTLWPMCY